MSYIGTNKVGKMYLGSTAIGKAYLGNDLVYDSAGSGQVFPYDAEIEYLQSSGTQYIDTGISPSTNFECEIKAEYINNQLGYDTLLGSFTSVNAYGVALAIRANGNAGGGANSGYIQFGKDGGGSLAISAITTLGLHTYKTSVKNGSISISVDGTATTNTYSAGNPSSLSMYMFARNKGSGTIGNYSKAKVYYCKIWNGGNLVFDAIPVRVGTTGYMYDKISGTLFGNGGSGSFTLGNDIGPQYTALNYIKFAGSQWILTDYHPNPKTHLVIDMQFESNGNASVGSGGNQWMSCYNNTIGRFYSNFGSNANQYGQMFYWFENPYVSAIWSGTYGNNIYNRSTFTYLNNKVTFQGTDTTTETKTTTQDGYLALGIDNAGTTIFNRHNLKIFSMKIYEDNVLLHEYLPKTDGTNNGLYDTVTHTFITSQTSTNLVGE